MSNPSGQGIGPANKRTTLIATGTVEIRRVATSMVSTETQRKIVPLCLVILGFGVFELVKAVYQKGPIVASIATILYGLLYYSQIDRVNPRTSLLFSKFVEYLARGIVKSLVPVFVSLVAFAVSIFFSANNSSAGIVALIFGGIAWWLSFNQPIPAVVNKLVRGRAEPIDLASSKAAEFVLDKEDPGITWGGLRIPSKFATSHFMVVGTTGSGKTVTLQLLMKEVLRQIGRGADHRALIYDAKQDLASQIPSMGIRGAVFTLNPFDERCVAWDMAKDITEPTAALQAAVTLIPSEKGASQPFFVDSAQLLLYGVMLSFIRFGADWRFSDLIKAMHTVDRLKRILERCPDTRHIADRFYHNRETLDEVMATVATKLTPYEPIAAMWDKAYEEGRKVSLNEWVQHRGKDNCVLILGNNEKARAAIDRINQIIFKRISELLLDLKEDRAGTRRNWIFLDELGEAGRLDGLSSLLTKGRSKGVCVVLGFQDFDTLREVYGENTAGALTSQCNCKAILRLESPRTAEWASKLFGDYEAIETRRSEARGTQQPIGFSQAQSTKSYTVTDTEHYIKRQSVMESQFYTLPPTDPEMGLTGFYLVPGIGCYRHTYPGPWLFPRKPEPEEAAGPLQKQPAAPEPVSDFKAWADPEVQWLKSWEEADAVARRLIDPIPPQEAEEPPPPEPQPESPVPQSQAPQPPQPEASPEEGTLEEPRVASPEETQNLVAKFKGFRARGAR